MFSVIRIIRKPNVRYFARSIRKIDPGINQRKKALALNEELEDTDFDDLESDFMSIHKSHREHVDEMKCMLEKEKFHIVKQKYFKEKYPNFLTWNDKEQIRYLHSTNPEEWTIDRLSEGFPALPPVIMKIIKSKWTKNSAKIKNHDLAVQKNWEMFKTGQIPNLPDNLVQHLNKFTNRALNLKPFEISENKKIVNIHNANKNTEFSDIIRSYEQLKTKNTKDLVVEQRITLNTVLKKPADGTNTYIMRDKNEFKEKGLVTLQELHSNIANKVEKGKTLSADDKLMIKSLKENSDVKIDVNKEKIVDIAKNKYEPGHGSLFKKSERDNSHLIYAERIMIPKNLYKRGHTYKLNDCYYDADGSFLYRVPGMG